LEDTAALGNKTRKDSNRGEDVFMKKQSVLFKGSVLFLIAIATSVSAGLDHTVILKLDGTVWAMGNGNEGALGDGGTSPRSTPIQVMPKP